MITLMLVLFIVLILAGIPIAWGTGLATILYIEGAPTIPLTLLAQRVFKASDSFSLLAIPLFMLAGEFMNGGGITKRIVELAFCQHVRVLGRFRRLHWLYADSDHEAKGL